VQHVSPEGLLEGTGYWHLPEDWREVGTRFSAALKLIERGPQLSADPPTVVQQLGDVVSAATMIQATPANLRPPVAKAFLTSAKRPKGMLALIGRENSGGGSVVIVSG